MKKTLSLALFSGVVFSLSVSSLAGSGMQQLTDSQLSGKTGQDGISVGIKGDGTIGIKHLRYIDGDGFTTNGFTNKAGVSVNFSDDIRMCDGSDAASATCTLATDPITIHVDTDGGNGSTATSNSAFINVNITAPIKALYVPIDSVSLITGTNNGGNWTGGQDRKILEFKNAAGTGSGGIAIDMANALEANIQLGEQPQGAMMLLSENTLNIDFGTLNFLSYAPTTSGGNSQLSTKVKVQGLSHNVVAVDIDKIDGISTKFTGETTIGAVTINDTVFGTKNQQATTTFDNLQNASIGNISVNTIKMQNLKVNVRGL